MIHVGISNVLGTTPSKLFANHRNKFKCNETTNRNDTIFVLQMKLFSIQLFFLIKSIGNQT